MQHLRIGPNAKGDYALKSNPIQFRFAARAAAHAGRWELIPLLRGRIGDCRYVAIRNTETGEERHILAYLVEAVEGAPYIRTLNEAGELGWAAGWQGGKVIGLPKIMADGLKHVVYSIHVKRPNEDGTLAAMEVAKSSWSRQFVMRYTKQLELGIKPGDETYLNPLAFVPKDALVAAIASGKAIGLPTRQVKLTRQLVATFKADEERIIAGLPYEPLTE